MTDHEKVYTICENLCLEESLTKWQIEEQILKDSGVPEGGIINYDGDEIPEGFEEVDDINSKNIKDSHAWVESTITITGDVKTRLNAKVLDFEVKSNKIRIFAKAIAKLNGGMGYIGVQAVNKKTNEVITIANIDHFNLTTNTTLCGEIVYNIAPGYYDFYLVAYSNNNYQMTIPAYNSQVLLVQEF